MFLSLAVILLGGMLCGRLCAKLSLPPLLGMLLWGIVTGPYCLNWIDASILDNAADLRQIALILILLRAGLNLNLEDLKKVGRPAVLMCFVPATLEILGTCMMGMLLLKLSLAESLLLGSVLAAVSPAVIVPHMLKLIDSGYGTREGVPQLILAGASADDIYVIVLFSCFTGLAATGSFNAATLLRIPTSILFGILAGFLCGRGMAWLFDHWKISDALKIIFMMSISFLLIVFENAMTGSVGFSGLLAIMSAAIFMKQKTPELSVRLSGKLSELWTCAEIFLFVLVGTAVNIEYAFKAGLVTLAVILIALVFRMIGVWISTAGSTLNTKERLFCMLAYTPKATVQAAIGAVPLSLGLACGNTILTAAVLAILITAPLGAFMIDLTYKKLLSGPKISAESSQ